LSEIAAAKRRIVTQVRICNRAATPLQGALQVRACVTILPRSTGEIVVFIDRNIVERIISQSQTGRVSHSFRRWSRRGNHRGWRGQHWMWVARVLKRSDDKRKLIHLLRGP